MIFLYQDTHRTHIEDLVKIEPLALHLAPDAVDMLGSAADGGLDAGLLEFGIEQANDARNIALAVLPRFSQLSYQFLVGLRFQIAQ